MGHQQRLIVGISGASGAIYGIRLLMSLKDLGVESHLIMSRAAELALTQETTWKSAQLRQIADVCYQPSNIGAAIASGSYQTNGMIIAPCSVRTMSEIATGVTSTLLSRAADVTLKERRRLVLVVRETPLHIGHLRTMLTLTEQGAIIAPPVPAFYVKPNSLEEMVDHTVGRLLDLFGLDSTGVRRWDGNQITK